MKLENKVAYITGGDGMGRQIALQYAKEGAKIGFITRSTGSAEETDRLLKEMGAEVVYTVGDVSDEEVLLASMKKTEDAFGPIDIVVNNVGMDIFKHFHELESSEWDKIFNINLKAAFLTSKYALQSMMERKTGVIINISSAAALHPSLEPHVYSVTKDALNMMTRIMAFDYAPYGIRVNSICPGLVFTKILKQVGEDYVNSIVETIPAKRIGQVQDIANMAVFLASEEASYVNGDVIAVDGGLSLA